MVRRLRYRRRRLVGVVALMVAAVGVILLNPASYETVWMGDEAGGESNESTTDSEVAQGETTEAGPLATEILAQLEIKGRAPKTGYDRDEFYSDWPEVDGCSLRQRILKREFGDTAVLDEENQCTVLAGEYDEPYTGEHMVFTERSEISSGVQIDHVVALSDAWQKGAQYMDEETRYALATDPLNLIAVDATANQQKSDGDAATWLPENKAFRCQYVARQIAVKYKYQLWVTQAEHDAMEQVLTACPSQTVVGVEED